MDEGFDIVTVRPENIEKTGFFCYMSKRKEPGYKQKRLWLEERLAEGLRIKILHEHGGRDTAFIEYVPGEYAWRAVHAPGYLVIHCLWVVGKGKGKGYGKRLLQECLDDARQQGKYGVVMISSDQTWLADKGLFLKTGFVETDQAPPAFQLLVYRFGDHPLPAFPKDWQSRAAAFGSGLTVVRTPQCPYVETATRDLLQSAEALHIPARVVELRSASEVQRLAPCAYGVFGVVHDGRFISYIYLKQPDLVKRLAGG